MEAGICEVSVDQQRVTCLMALSVITRVRVRRKVCLSQQENRAVKKARDVIFTFIDLSGSLQAKKESELFNSCKTRIFLTPKSFGQKIRCPNRPRSPCFKQQMKKAFCIIFFSILSTVALCHLENAVFPPQFDENENQDSWPRFEGDDSEINESFNPADPAETREASIAVVPTTRKTVALPPTGLSPEGIMFENQNPSNVQTFQVPGVGMPIDQSQQVPFIFINNVAAESPRAAAVPGVAEAVYGGTSTPEQISQCEQLSCYGISSSFSMRNIAVNALCVSTLGASYRYSPRKKLCEPSNLVAAEEEAANAQQARLVIQPSTPQEAYEQALMGEGM
ncbi:hypothetical protein Esti_003729 [Eimeria stiedai]